jgi:serine/threonine-protein kinase
MGKMGYMSPEQIRGERLTQRSDIFSTGIVFWELLAMRRLFPADQPEERMESILRGNYPRPSSLRPDVSPELDAVVMKALELSPEARFATIREFSAALEPTARVATRREIGSWVSELAQGALADRTRMVARLENWAEGPQIPLSSSPFASEIPPSVTQPPSVPPPGEMDPLANALRGNLSVNALALAKASQPRPARSPSFVWILLAIVIAGVVGYVAHR